MKFTEKISYRYRKLLVLLMVFGCLTLSETVNAETEINQTVLFQPPPEESQPEETEGAASRQNRVCSQDIAAEWRSPIKLTAIVPDSNYGLTVAERPTFWFYLPETSATKVILTLKEKGQNPHWQQSVNIVKKPGIVGIKLSDKAPPLEVEKEYQWAVILVCGNKPHPNDPVVTATIERVNQSQAISDTSINNNYTALEKAAIYAESGIWHDPLDILVSQKYSLTDWNNIWAGYLQSAGLDEMSYEQVIAY